VLTVVFATRDRADALPRVLDAFAALLPPPGGWRLVVVDNGSADGTARVLEANAARLPLVAEHEPVPGKNRALNRGLGRIEGGLAVLTDDDVLPDRDWLVRMARAAADHPGATMLAGAIRPEWPGPLPSWLDPARLDFGVLYSELSLPAGPCGPDHVWGPNMAVRADVFRAGVRFAEDVGPDASRSAYAMGSETELVRRLAAAGHAARFVPEAAVRHIVRPEQVTVEWVLERAYRYGLGYAGDPAHLLALRRTVYGLAAPAAAILPPTPLSVAVRYKARWLAGIADAARSRAA
jgi:glycosyltransferase involved in cell wall biosynthesis